MSTFYDVILIPASTNIVTVTPNDYDTVASVTLTITDADGSAVAHAGIAVADPIAKTWSVTIGSGEIATSHDDTAFRLDWRLVDDDGQVRTVRKAAWVTLTPDESDPSHAEYVLAGGRTVPMVDWSRYVLDAWRIVRDVTRDAIDDATTTADLAAIDEAVFRCADVLYQANNNVKAEKIGTYSVTYGDASPKTNLDAQRAVIAALRGTGMTYRGMPTGSGSGTLIV